MVFNLTCWAIRSASFLFNSATSTSFRILTTLKITSVMSFASPWSRILFSLRPFSTVAFTWWLAASLSSCRTCSNQTITSFKPIPVLLNRLCVRGPRKCMNEPCWNLWMSPRCINQDLSMKQRYKIIQHKYSVVRVVCFWITVIPKCF